MATSDGPHPEPTGQFDAANVFDDDYLYFYAGRLTPERDEADAGRVWDLLGLEPGMAVLDAPCGHGRIANRLAARGAQVTGLDATPSFLALARADAAARDLDVEYIEGDLRHLPWTGRFDRIVNWFTSFGYFDDDGNRQVLAEAHGALTGSGRMLVEVPNAPFLLANLRPEITVDREGDWMIDRMAYDPLTGRVDTSRTIIRNGRSRTARFFVRLLGFPELRDWLRTAGFSQVAGYGEDGGPLTAGSRRMIVVAGR